MVDVVQTDRTSAETYLFSVLEATDDNFAMAKDILAGNRDHDPLVQAFAAHRIATEQAFEAKLAEAVESERVRGQAEGKSAVLTWLRDKLAQKPNPPFAKAASMLADQFERSETPCQGIRP